MARFQKVLRVGREPASLWRRLLVRNLYYEWYNYHKSGVVLYQTNTYFCGRQKNNKG